MRLFIKNIFVRVALTLLAMFCFSWAYAENITAEQALQLAQTFVSGQNSVPGGRHNSPGMTLQLTQEKQVSGLYVFNVADNGGFVVVSNDDRTAPILGFGESGHLDPDNMPENMRAWLQGYADQIAWLQTHSVKPSRPGKAPRRVGTHSTEAIPPMVTTTWNQGSPYNNLCPTYSYGYKSATGCVATAMAQVMKYHEWPQTSTKAIPGYTTDSYQLTLSTLPVVTFDWANMLNDYQGGETSAQQTAVATLMKYCGYSVQMDYGPSSGSNTDLVAAALVEYYDYNATTQFVTRSHYTYANWTDLIYHELAHDRPVVYGGMSTGGGHEFVCDGYKYENGTDFFHINWGWGGTSDDYFVLSALDPDEQGIGGSSSTDGFHFGQDAVIGIQPSTGTGTTADITPHEIDLTLVDAYANPSPVLLGQSVDLVVKVTNNSEDPYDGDIMLYEETDNYDEYILSQVFYLEPGETKECVFTITPTQLGTYSFIPLRNDFYFFEVPQEHTISFEVVEEMAEVPEGLTVCNGTVTNQQVPAYIYYFDNFARSQFVIPAAQLEEMDGGSINSISFYTNSTSTFTTDSPVDVYMKEVDYTTINAFETKESATMVYQGKLRNVKLSSSTGLMTITLSTPYSYDGGNLLIGIENTVDAGYKSVSFYGVSAAGASVSGQDNNSLDNVSPTQQNFLPKTTFAYETGSNTCEKPATFDVSGITANEATFTWTGDADNYTLEYKKRADEEWTVVADIKANTYTLSNLTQDTPYSARVKTVCGNGSESGYRTLGFTTLEQYPTPSALTCNGVSATSVTLEWTENGSATAWQICVDDHENQLVDVTENPYTLTGLTADTNYEIKVRADYGTAQSSWSNTVSVFTGYCTPNPTSRDKKGITKVVFGMGDYVVQNVDESNGLPASAPFYANYVTMIGAMQAGVEGTVSITYATGYTYGTLIWVDWNNNMLFEDSEIVYTGTSTNSNPTTLDATFTVPADQAVGDYRMRIAGADSYFDNFVEGIATALHDPCFTSSYAVCHDYTLRVLEAPSVITPTGLTVSYTGGDTAEVSWTSLESVFDIDVNGSVTENVGNPYTLEGLDLGTSYTVKVRAKKDNDVSEWSNSASFTTDLCMPEDMCEITFVLTDRWGDGWNNASIKVVDVLTGEVIASMANENLNGTSGSGENEVNTRTLSLCNGREVQFLWVSGSYDSECSYVVTDVNDHVIFSGSGGFSNPVNYVMDCSLSVYKSPSELTASEIGSRSATMSWTGNVYATGYNLRYRVAPLGGTLTTDFDDSSMGEWTTIDADGDGFTWVLGSAAGGIYLTEGGSLADAGHQGSADLVTSGSYRNVDENGGVALTPDNYLVSPLVKLGGSITFYAGGQDASYAAEHFGVAVSTTSNIDPAAFTTIWESDMTAARQLNDPARVGLKKAQGTWYQFSVDLSDYSGQGYVAIRHFNCTDQFMLNVDDIVIEQPGEEEVAWTEVNNVASPYTIEGLAPETKYTVGVQAVYEGGSSAWAATNFTTKAFLELANDATDNSSLIADNAGKVADVMLVGRTLYKDGKWNTICLPFNVSLSGGVLDGAIARSLTTASIDGSTLNLNFSGTVNTLQAGTPYLIRWTSGDDIVSPVFEGITIDKTDRNFDSGSGDTRVRFLGNYDAKIFTDGDNESVLLMGGDNTLRYANAKAGLGACRAYFQIGEDGSAARVTAFNMNFGDETTGIRSIDNEPLTMDGDEAWYTLDGRKLNGMPTTKGVYIYMGNHSKQRITRIKRIN